MDEVDKAPLFEALMNWKESRPVSYHVPGHKNGIVFSTYQGADEVYKSLLEIDATELTGLDDLHAADGPIRKAEELTADLYGSIDSRFLVGGSTAGNLAMLMAICKEGDYVFVQKNCHKSIWNGLRLSKANPIFLSPELEPDSQVATGITLALLQKALVLYPEVKVIVLTNPNYYGMSRNLKEIISYAHDNGVSVLVDEAHGAHFVNDAYFPGSAIRQGADVVVHSAHKTLPAMTMGSYLHIGNDTYRDAINDYLQIFQSSSPSYPIMASLDLARLYLASLSEGDIEQILDGIRMIKRQLGKMNGVKVIGEFSTAFERLDPLKLTVQIDGLTGYELARKLEQEGIFVELADPLNVLLVLPLAFVPEQFKETIEAFERIVSKQQQPRKAFPFHNLVGEDITTPAYSFVKLETMTKKQIELKGAAHLVAARAIIPYPPGIPVVMPGERLSTDVIRLLEAVVQGGGHVQGMKENTIEIAIEEE
ncbi:aminotransferase class I/II-fold pyridoxal phosphate-dependent enzyme [Pseudalkalibacillus hwajinpoensis]|uniref:aminotransferase class I/II-fold pyridoxal phosphate-dependent enzyme n=1 Tax=Guptibacillus hwajinpoensis TaxID=208199 RepID=UPI00325B6AA1